MPMPTNTLADAELYVRELPPRTPDREFRALGRRLALAEPYYEASIVMDREVPEWSGGGEPGGSPVRRRVVREGRALDSTIRAILA